MNGYERRQTIVELLREEPGLRVTELAANLDVSEGTVRNDLNTLEEEGMLTRIHGGAVLTERRNLRHTAFRKRHRERGAEKQAIARAAANLVEDGDAILLDASSTAYYLALALENKQGLRVVTNGLEAARLLAQNSTNTVILIGGILNQDGSSVTGLLSEHIIQDLFVQKAFVSCSGFNIERGLTEVHLEEAQLKSKAIQSVQYVYALVDSSKLGHKDLTPFARLEQICCLFTDGGISPDWIQKIENAGIEVTICELEP